ncbi:fatty acid desaturase [Ferrovum sp.]|uniref:DesA family fatty acid desaturase n=2 Tax=Ferrovum sp. TaxID=2609467 RepID=UPI00345045F4
MHSGILSLSWVGDLVAALVLTHITIASVTIFLHRHQAHRALELGRVASHFFRFWLWLTTGMVTRQWAAIHRKHHAKCETPEDPHSPQVLGLSRVLWGGVFLYVKESRNAETMARFGHGTPNDWLENHLYAAHERLGVTLMALVDMALFGLVPGVLIWLVQMVWIPFWAAGVVNGVGHFWGYRNFNCKDASTNIFPWGILIGGEELHNNHHTFATSAKLSHRWYEFDIGWMYIRLLQGLGQARVKSVAPQAQFDPAKRECDLATLHAIIRNRYDVMRRYTRELATTCAQEFHHLGESVKSPSLSRREVTAMIGRWLHHPDHELPRAERHTLARVMEVSRPVGTVVQMRRELEQLWTRTNASAEQLLEQLRDWCRRAEDSGIQELMRFSRTLRAYA